MKNSVGFCGKKPVFWTAYWHSITNICKKQISTQYRNHQASLQVLCQSKDSRVLWNPKFHYRIHNSTSRVSILSQINPVHAAPSRFLQVHFNIIPSIHRSSKLSPSLRSFQQNRVCISPVYHTCHMPCPSHLLYLVTRIIFGEECRP